MKCIIWAIDLKSLSDKKTNKIVHSLHIPYTCNCFTYVCFTGAYRIFALWFQYTIIYGTFIFIKSLLRFWNDHLKDSPRSIQCITLHLWINHLYSQMISIEWVHRNFCNQNFAFGIHVVENIRKSHPKIYIEEHYWLIMIPNSMRIEKNISTTESYFGLVRCFK